MIYELFFSHFYAEPVGIFDFVPFLIQNSGSWNGILKS